MPVRLVESKQNARVKELRQAMAKPGRDAHGAVGIEGRNLLVEALRAKLAIRTVFVAKGSERQLDGLSLPAKTEVVVLPATVLASAQATETPQPIAALVEPPDWSWVDILRNRGNAGKHGSAGKLGSAAQNVSPALILVLAGIQDPGNLGTILRSAEAFGASGVVSLPGTVSAWNPKAVRASAGSVFRVAFVSASEKVCIAQLREAGVRILATTARGAAPADQVDMAGSVALMIGNEGNGVAEDLIAKSDAKITIPCPGPVESLNAAMAATVLLYEAAHQRTARISESSGSPQSSSKGLPHAVGTRR
jgi:TrmH family RNA methyltransferase